MIDIRTIDFDNLNCEGCPARQFLDIERSRQVEAMRLCALRRLKVPPRILLLCESAPPGRFVYDKKSDYRTTGLRANLRNELTVEKTDDALFEFLNTKGIWIVDAALCPLHKDEILTPKQRRHAATFCLSRHTRVYIDSLPSTRIIAAFPSNRGFLVRQLPDIARRTPKPWLNFSLKGLKEKVDQILSQNPNRNDNANSIH